MQTVAAMLAQVLRRTLDDLRRLVDLGYSRVIVRYRGSDAEEQRKQLRIFIDHIIPKCEMAGRSAAGLLWAGYSCCSTAIAASKSGRTRASSVTQR